MATITITFTATAETGDVVIELDNEMNKGKTQFLYGEKAYFKVFYDPSLVLSVTASDGTITEEGYGQEQIEETFNFVDTNEVKVRKPILSLVETTWFGQSLGSLQKDGLFKLVASEQPNPENKVAIAKVKYVTQFKRYAIRVSNKPYDEYPVLVSVVGKLP